MRRASLLVDAPLASFVFLAWAAYFLAGWVFRRRRKPASNRLLVLDTSYSLPVLRARGQIHSVTCRDLDGFFEHVWSCHPLTGSSPDDPDGDAKGPVSEERIAPRHTFITGHVPRGRSRGPFGLTRFALSQFAVFRRLDRLIGHERIGVIRVGDPFYQALFGLGLCRIHRIPIVLRAGAPWDSVWETSHSLAYPTLFPSHRLQKAIDRFTLPRMDLVAGTNRDNLNYALANGVPKERGTIFPYGDLIDPSHFQPPSDRPSPESDLDELDLSGRPFFIYVARLERLKYHDDLLAAFAPVKTKAPTARLVFVGHGTLRDALIAKAQELGLGQAIVFAGPRNQEWLVRVMPRATAVIALSAGRSLVEGALSGRPVIAYDFEWHREIIEDGRTGILVPFRNVNALTAALVRTLDDRAQAERRGAAGRERVLREHHPNLLVQRQRDQYAQLLKETANVD